MENQKSEFTEINNMMNNVLSLFHGMELSREGDLLAKFYGVIKHRTIGKPAFYGEDDDAKYLESCRLVDSYINEVNELQSIL